MRVFSVSSISFRDGKIELDDINMKDLSNYTSIKRLAKENFCDLLIEKKSDFKSLKGYDLFKVIARRKWVNPRYIFGLCAAAVPKSATPDEIARTVYQISMNAANITREKAIELAKNFIK